MQNYTRLNVLFGWLAFLISATVYILTVEPTTSFWDCGEFIAASHKLLVGHPPGAPFFLLVGNFFTLFANDVSKIALSVNIMSALASALTIAFLFWTITHLGFKIFIKNSESPKPWRAWAVLAAGMVGALAYTFSDTFWFSAVEGEVYAMSSLFTAMVFWAILKWENVAGEPHSNRWIILIAYLMGLSIGVHLLNLLAIPAIVMVYYFKKYEVNRNNTIKALVLAGVILLVILYGIIPGVVKVASWFELLFVNEFGLPFNTGVVIYALLLIGGLCFGIYYTYVKQKPVMNTILTGIAVILMGYSSFALIVIRSSANPTMDQNSPEDVFSLQYYLNREQYGDRPLFSGQYYNSPFDWDRMEGDKGSPLYAKRGKKYEVVDYRTNYRFDERTTTLLPRMYSRDPRHIEAYKQWGNVTGKPVTIINDSGNPTTLQLPTFFENISFFINYQVRFMYLRYFMWNFSGRQNDIQSHGEIHHGNWITGIPIIDNLMYGDQSKLPDYLKNNPANNKYYMLPLLLGIIGLLFQLGAGVTGRRDFWVVMLLFFFTGLAIVIYLNQTPFQPRERDYAYAGSFYAFAIWIGLGVLGIINGLKKVMAGKIATPLTAIATLILVPGIMASENWDDHDRSNRTIARDLAYNYLNTVGENGIIFTNGDNDTFPLWYAQEVEGIRTDVRVCNLSYLQTDWYIDQMRRKSYESDPLPFSMERKTYETGKRDVVHLFDRFEGRGVDLKEAIKFLVSDDPRTKQIANYRGRIEHLPSKSFYLDVDVDKVIENGIVREEYADKIDSILLINFSKDRLLKNELMVLDLLVENNWERPIYYAVTVGSDNYVELDSYFQLEGFAYQIVPITGGSPDGQYGRVDTERMYDKVMNVFRFDGWNDDRVYLDENHQRMGINIRNNLSRLAIELIREGKEDKAHEVLDKTMDIFPPERIPHNYFSLFLAEGYYRIEQDDKADEIIRDFADLNYQELEFFTSLNSKYRNASFSEIQRNMAIYAELVRMLNTYSRDTLVDELNEKYDIILKRLGFFEG